MLPNSVYIMTPDFLEHMRNSQTRLHEQKIAFGLNDKKDDYVVLEDDMYMVDKIQTTHQTFFSSQSIANL